MFRIVLKLLTALTMIAVASAAVAQQRQAPQGAPVVAAQPATPSAPPPAAVQAPAPSPVPAPAVAPSASDATTAPVEREGKFLKAAAAELLGACPSSRARSKIEGSFSLRPFSRPPSLVLRSTTGAIRGRCEEAVLGRIESHSLLFNRVALLGHTPRLAVPGVLVWPMLLAAGKVKRNELPLAVDWSSRFPSSSWASPSTNACP